MNKRQRKDARAELDNLRAHAALTGCDLRSLISVPEFLRDAILRMADPELSEAIAIRDYMLERL